MVFYSNIDCAQSRSHVPGPLNQKGDRCASQKPVALAGEDDISDRQMYRKGKPIQQGYRKRIAATPSFTTIPLGQHSPLLRDWNLAISSLYPSFVDPDPCRAKNPFA
jgi:hypothetical protein